MDYHANLNLPTLQLNSLRTGSRDTNGTKAVFQSTPRGIILLGPHDEFQTDLKAEAQEFRPSNDAHVHANASTHAQDFNSDILQPQTNSSSVYEFLASGE